MSHVLLFPQFQVIMDLMLSLTSQIVNVWVFVCLFVFSCCPEQCIAGVGGQVSGILQGQAETDRRSNFSNGVQ